MGRITETVKVILIANILFYVGSLSIGEDAYSLFSMFFPLNEKFHFWQIVTHMFMHDPSMIFHILFNMFMLYMFGSQMESYLGRNRFLFLYFSAGLGAVGLHLVINYLNYLPGYNAFMEAGFTASDVKNFLTNGVYNSRLLDYIDSNSLVKMFNSYNSPMLGASGAIFGLLAAFTVLYPNLPLMIMFIPIPIKAKYLIGGYFALNLISAVSGVSLAGPSNTAYWAHIGGAAVGFIIMYYWKKNSFNDHRWN
ncbi:MAG: rhomboid family intramembrane serine protease [Flavobacteriaceae bacterium]|nr:rhomboid family intramembrane serine protease [Flavobacteriaceae bacterium]